MVSPQPFFLLLLLLSLSEAERVPVMRTILEVDDARSCDVVLGGKVVDVFSHLSVRGGTLRSDGTVTPPPGACITPERMASFREVGVAMLLQVGGPEAGEVWAELLQKDTEAAATALAASVYPGTAWDGLVLSFLPPQGDRNSTPWATAELLSSSVDRLVKLSAAVRRRLPPSVTLALIASDSDAAKRAVIYGAAERFNASGIAFISVKFGEVAQLGHPDAFEVLEDLSAILGESSVVAGSCVGHGCNGMTAERVATEIIPALPRCSGGFFAFETENAFLLSRVSRPMGCPAASSASVSISDGKTGLLIHLPGGGGYQGTRYDWGSFATSATVRGLDLDDIPRWPHSFGPDDRTVRDPANSAARAGFAAEWHGVLGWSITRDTFLKIGVGTLAYPNGPPPDGAVYNASQDYILRERAEWKVSASATEVTFVATDTLDTLGYELTRRYYLEGGVINLETTLRNTGGEAFDPSLTVGGVVPPDGRAVDVGHTFTLPSFPQSGLSAFSTDCSFSLCAFLRREGDPDWHGLSNAYSFTPEVTQQLGASLRGDLIVDQTGPFSSLDYVYNFFGDPDKSSYRLSKKHIDADNIEVVASRVEVEENGKLVFSGDLSLPNLGPTQFVRFREQISGDVMFREPPDREISLSALFPFLLMVILALGAIYWGTVATKKREPQEVEAELQEVGDENVHASSATLI